MKSVLQGRCRDSGHVGLPLHTSLSGVEVQSDPEEEPPDSSLGREYLTGAPKSTGANFTAFRKRHFPQANAKDWNNWHWQLQHSIRTFSELQAIFQLSERESKAMEWGQRAIPMAITPYYAALMSATDEMEPLRRTHVPVLDEMVRGPGDMDDPLGEEHKTVVPGLVHRYPDRVLFLATDRCASYCRYCTRSRLVGADSDPNTWGGLKQRWERAFDYIEAHPEVRDVIISGGDPLTLGDDRLDYILTRLRAIKHVEILRLGTKVPMVLPMRITRALASMLKKFRPLWINMHCTHPDELTQEASTAIGHLANAGIPLGSQTVLLAGVNDHSRTLMNLFHHLLTLGVRPYYLYQCDPIAGSSHFRVPVTKGLEIMSQLRGFTSGLAIPTFVLDAPDNGGKIPLLPGSPLNREGGNLLLTNYEGRICHYPDAVDHSTQAT